MYQTWHRSQINHTWLPYNITAQSVRDLCSELHDRIIALLSAVDPVPLQSLLSTDTLGTQSWVCPCQPTDSPSGLLVELFPALRIHECIEKQPMGAP